ncbi:hypothetical protein [Thiolapillus sp.]|uniref:hypothetical protein n=1 Tax=Thiolapillus sp. TaxID=2017437 RepID=UPI003AF5CC37
MSVVFGPLRDGSPGSVHQSPQPEIAGEDAPIRGLMGNRLAGGVSERPSREIWRDPVFTDHFKNFIICHLHFSFFLYAGIDDLE